MKYIIVIVTLFLSVLLVLLLSIVVFFLYKRSRTSSKVDDDDLDFRYRYFELNPNTDESTVGIVSFSHELESDFITYRVDKSNNLALVSNFNTIEYKCTGLCFCDSGHDDDELGKRRYVGSSSHRFLSKLTYLLAAVSSTVAYTLAKNHFDDECKNSFPSSVEECDNLVFSEVENCESIHINSDLWSYEDEDEDWDEDEDEEDENLTQEEREYFANIKKYFCSGHCLKTEEIIIVGDIKNPFYDDDVVERMERYAKDYNCKKLEMESEITVDHNKYQSLTMDAYDFSVNKGKVIDHDGELNEYRIEIARLVFGNDNLDPFCKRLGEIEGNTIGVYYSSSPYGTMCTAGVGKNRDPLKNKSIKCVKKDKKQKR